MTRWTHAHTFTGGLVAGLAADRHTALAVAAALLLGLAAGRLWHVAATAARTILERLSRPPAPPPGRPVAPPYNREVDEL